MKAYWKVLSDKVLALSRRERILVLAAMLALVWMLADTVIFTPLQNRLKHDREGIVSLQAQVSQLKAQQAQLVEAAHYDPDAANRARLAELQRRLAQLDADLKRTQQALVAPEEMPRVLESLLQKNPHVKLVGLVTLPVSKLMGAPAEDKSDGVMRVGIYKHGYELTLEGRYLDLLRYVQALEAAPWQMLWGQVSLQAGSYPSSTLKLTLYTLSLDAAWLSI
ncbi:MAG: hypothetical protein N2Z69_09040 [Methylophilaceae bacterium]|nr:hypothetical protein [Methylophilaceae bacterium]